MGNPQRNWLTFSNSSTQTTLRVSSTDDELRVALAEHKVPLEEGH